MGRDGTGRDRTVDEHPGWLSTTKKGHRQSKAGMTVREGKVGQVLEQGQSKGK